MNDAAARSLRALRETMERGDPVAALAFLPALERAAKSVAPAEKEELRTALAPVLALAEAYRRALEEERRTLGTALGAARSYSSAGR